MAVVLPRVEAGPGRLARAATWMRRHPTVAAGSAILAVIALAGIAAPLITPVDPLALDPVASLLPPGAGHWFGTDHMGRDVFTRVIYGTRVSLIVAVSVALAATVIGLFLGLVAGYLRRVDAVVMRIMDGLMAIPGVLLAIALMAVMRASLTTVILAIMVPEIPRVVRLVRGVVLTLRELPFVEAAVVAGTQLPRILTAHILPNALAPLIVQATYICASAIIIEAALSFLGAGTPPEVPSWGNIMAEGRGFFLIAPWLILFPGIWLTLTVLAINLLGDGLRDMLDPRLRRRM
ncbi:MAG TPA: ABC transporter permease [Geminicoccaceae bacterium]|nr:ABC transporter permease [Geminicoccus sp.]HMU48526.1 ABC transporter permease [Geminicoccaceae bacterium]